ncbi:MAG: hypothetical protein ACPH44_05425, partial [Parvibaculales bacterium]
SLLPAALLVGTFLQSAVAQDAPPVPDIMPPAAELKAEDTPPPPLAALAAISRLTAEADGADSLSFPE